MQSDIQRALEVLNNGGIIIFPTDTAFGIGCRIDNADAIEKLFKLRRRPATQATPVLVANLEMAQEYLQPVSKDILEKMVEPYWPGALTIVLPCNTDKVLSLVRGGTETLGVRMPDNETLLEIIKAVGVPILGPSANFHEEQTPYSFDDLDPELIKQVDFVFKGECLLKQASTVIDCSVNPWEILRQGAVRIAL